jgi:GNAT superfamily N-acetyltransferase
LYLTGTSCTLIQDRHLFGGELYKEVNKKRDMKTILRDLSADRLVKKAIKENWENYHYCLGRSPSVELSLGRYLSWFITNVPDHFMNLVVCTELPPEGPVELIERALDHFKSLHIRKVTWLVQEGVPAAKIKRHLLSHGLTLNESFGAEMAADLSSIPENVPVPAGLKIVRVEDKETLQQWIHVASIGFNVPAEYEDVWYEFFVEAVFEQPFWSYLAVLDDHPVGTSQLFLSAGVAGIYNVTCVPEARGLGIGAAITLAPLLDARAIGYRIAILQASEMGVRVYRRLGFQDFGHLSVYLWKNDVEP